MLSPTTPGTSVSVDDVIGGMVVLAGRVVVLTGKVVVLAGEVVVLTGGVVTIGGLTGSGFHLHEAVNVIMKINRNTLTNDRYLKRVK